MDEIRVTHIGGPTTLLEIGPWRLLTDPTFDPPGRRYAFGWGSSSRKLTGPALPASAIEPIDAVLLSHDQHADNLDDAGRAVLPRAGKVITTTAGARRLGKHAIGLAPWESTTLAAEGKPDIQVVATPCRHGAPGVHFLAGDVTGFALRWHGQKHGVLWVTGDTVWFSGLRKVADRLHIGTMLLHLGGVRFPVTGPLRYTLQARQAVDVIELMMPHTVIPVHIEGWSHFEGAEKVSSVFSSWPTAVQQRVREITPGTSLTVGV
jgi:L-ascorbate metabolism protein UlaG (beta-lactamase superfamily)